MARRSAADDPNGCRARGERNGNAKLSYTKSEEIKRLYAEGRTLLSLAEEYGVGTSSVHSVVKGRTWIRSAPAIPLWERRLTSPTILDRFWSRIDKKTGADACWEWTGDRKPDWHGRINIGARTMPAHRYSWELHNGPVTDSRRVLHRCDNPICVRPDHLWLGTDLDNVQDCRRKGRLACGPRNGRVLHPERYPILRGEQKGGAKLTEVQVREIREVYAKGRTSQKSLAENYGVGQQLISNVVLRKIWTHVE